MRLCVVKSDYVFILLGHFKSYFIHEINTVQCLYKKPISVPVMCYLLMFYAVVPPSEQKKHFHLVTCSGNEVSVKHRIFTKMYLHRAAIMCHGCHVQWGVNFKLIFS